MGKEHDIQKFEGATRNGQSRDTGNNVHKKKAKQNKTEQKTQALGYRMSCEMLTPYTGDAGILLLMKGKLTIEKVKS
jgi:hypothetical protein